MEEEARGNFSPGPLKMFRKGQFHSAAGKEQQTERGERGEGLKARLRGGRLSHGHGWFHHQRSPHTFLLHPGKWPWYRDECQPAGSHSARRYHHRGNISHPRGCWQKEQILWTSHTAVHQVSSFIPLSPDTIKLSQVKSYWKTCMDHRGGQWFGPKGHIRS